MIKIHEVKQTAALIFGMLAASLPAAATGADADFLPAQVVDATGKVVGRFIGEGSVLLVIEHRRVNLQLQYFDDASTAGLAWVDTSGNPFFYRSNDCSGEAFMELTTGSFGTVPAILDTTGGGAKLTVAKGVAAERVQGDWHSYFYFGSCYQTDRQFQYLWRAEPPIDLGSLYKLPLQVR